MHRAVGFTPRSGFRAMSIPAKMVKNAVKTEDSTYFYMAKPFSELKQLLNFFHQPRILP
jgi:hypothetical protein